MGECWAVQAPLVLLRFSEGPHQCLVVYQRQAQGFQGDPRLPLEVPILRDLCLEEHPRLRWGLLLHTVLAAEALPRWGDTDSPACRLLMIPLAWQECFTKILLHTADIHLVIQGIQGRKFPPLATLQATTCLRRHILIHSRATGDLLGRLVCDSGVSPLFRRPLLDFPLLVLNPL